MKKKPGKSKKVTKKKKVVKRKARAEVVREMSPEEENDFGDMGCYDTGDDFDYGDGRGLVAKG